MIDRAAIARWNEQQRRCRVIYDHLPTATTKGGLAATPCHRCRVRTTTRASGLCKDCEAAPVDNRFCKRATVTDARNLKQGREIA